MPTIGTSTSTYATNASIASTSNKPKTEAVSTAAQAATDGKPSWVVSDTVKLSAKAQQSPFKAGRIEDQALSRDELRNKYERAMNDFKYLDEDGVRNAEKIALKVEDPERLGKIQKGIAFIHGEGENPYKKLSRDELVGMIFDDTGKYTTIERMVALSEKQNRDTDYLTGISDFEDNASDNRILYKGLLKYSEILSPIERASKDFFGLAETALSLLKSEEKKYTSPLDYTPPDYPDPTKPSDYKVETIVDVLKQRPKFKTESRLATLTAPPAATEILNKYSGKNTEAASISSNSSSEHS